VKNNSCRPFNISRSRKTFNPNNYSNVKAWIVKAIAEESKKSPDQMWEKEPSAETISDNQLK
jgi:hypothetical protein